jgi:hypothetical protein
MRRAHSAQGRKSGSCQSATQIVLRIAMLAGEMWTCEAENGSTWVVEMCMASNFLASHRSTMLQSGWAKRSRIRQRCSQR